MSLQINNNGYRHANLERNKIFRRNLKNSKKSLTIKKLHSFALCSFN